MDHKVNILIAAPDECDRNRVQLAIAATRPDADFHFASVGDDVINLIQSSSVGYAFCDEHVWNDVDATVRRQLVASCPAQAVVVLTGDESAAIDREALDTPMVELVPLSDLNPTVVRLLFRDKGLASEATPNDNDHVARSIQDERKKQVARESAFLRDVLSSVTGGKLTLCFSDDEMPAPRFPYGDPTVVTAVGGIRELRRMVVAACREIAMETERVEDFESAGGEAAMNAVVHATEGIGRVMIDQAAGLVQLWVSDTGAGIAVASLPHATLRRGYSSVGTMGHGFKMILKTADRVYLRTSSDGTTLLLEMDKTPPVVDSMWG